MFSTGIVQMQHAASQQCFSLILWLYL